MIHHIRHGARSEQPAEKSPGAISAASPPAYVRQLTDYGEALEETMKKLVLSIVAVLLVATSAFAGSIFRVDPVTPEEKAAGKVLELLDQKRSANDAKGASELYAEDAVLSFYWGSQDELKVMRGRLEIYIALSSASIQGAELYDIVLTKLDNVKAEATGRMKVDINAFGSKWLKEPEVKWEIRLNSNGQWRIYREAHSRAAAVRL